MVKRLSRLAVVASIALSAGACTQLDNTLASVPFLAFMRNAPSFDPYEAPRNAPPGSIPFESPAGVYLPPQEPTETALQAFALSPAGRNPFQSGDTAVLALGKKMYDRHCMVCHNTDGTGNGPVVGPGKFPLAPTLVGSTALGKSDGYIYGIIRAGRNLMPAYGARINHTERWAIATYVKHLQAQGGAAVPAAPQTTGAPGAAPAGTPAPAGQESR